MSHVSRSTFKIISSKRHVTSTAETTGDAGRHEEKERKILARSRNNSMDESANRESLKSENCVKPFARPRDKTNSTLSKYITALR